MQLLIISNSSFRNGPKDLVARTCGNFKFYSRLVRSSSPRDLLVKVVIDLVRGNFVVSERPSIIFFASTIIAVKYWRTKT